MNKVISSLLLICFTSNIALADCDFKTGITPGPNKTFIYSEECHLKVGQLVQDNAVQLAQIADLNKAITLKDLAITTSDSRIALWSSTSDNLEQRLQRVDSMQSKNEFIYFGLGILATIGVGFAVAKLAGH